MVPPEEPEDWTRPLTWVAALGILAGPAVTLAWFWISPPAASTHPVAGTWIAAWRAAGRAEGPGVRTS